MGTLRIVAVTGIVALLLAACEEGPVAEPSDPEPEGHAIEGTWQQVEARLRVRGFVYHEDTGERAEYDQETAYPAPDGYERQVTFDSGVYTSRTRAAVGSPYATSRGTYHIDEESQRVVVLHEYDYADRGTIWRYELDGQDGLTLHQQIERGIGAPPIIDDEGNEVTVTETTAIWAFERVVE